MEEYKKALLVFGGGHDSLGERLLMHETLGNTYTVIRDFSLPEYDLTNQDDVYKAVRDFRDGLRDIDELHVVNFVGMMDNGKIREYSLERFQKVMDVNLNSLFLVAKAVMPFLETYRGRFVTIGSNAGEQGFTGMAAYCSSKFAVQGFIQCMAKECAPFNVPVNVVNPGAFHPSASRMSRVQVAQFMEQSGKNAEEVMDMLTSRIPMKRLATHADLCELLHALLNEYPRFYTGQAVSLSGGQVM